MPIQRSLIMSAGQACRLGVVLSLLLLGKTATADLLWSDEFDAQDDGLNTNFWSYETGGGGWGNGELQIYTTSSSNSKVEGGILKIIAREEEGQTFTSARIKTEDKMSFKYGTLEARIQVPDVNAGLWAAFWTMGASFSQVGWPRAGEIDIMEIGQGLAIEEGLGNKRVVSAAHWDYKSNYATYAKSFDSPTDLSQGFHIYRLEWTPDAMTTTVDGQIIWSMNIGPMACEDCEELHMPHFVVLNLAVGGGFTSGSASSSGSSGCGGSSSAGVSSSGGCSTRGPEDISAPLPGEMLVDWIRLYDNGYTEVTLPSTPQPTTMGSTAEAQTPPPTLMPTPLLTSLPTPGPTSLPTPQPTLSPIPSPTSSLPTPLPTPQQTTPLASTPPPTTPPSPQPTTAPVVVSLPISPVATTAPRQPVSLPPAPLGRDSQEDDFFGDDDCFHASGSRSSGGKGKGGKGGKSGSSQSSTARSGGKAGKGYRQRRHRRGLKSEGKGSSSKGKGGSGSRSGSGRCGTHGEGRVSAQSSYLQANAASSTPPIMIEMSLFLCLVLTGLNVFLY